MSKIEVNQISSQCGSTLTIGQSGDTVTLAAGATQSGFGRTGTVDWDTTAKTASFTAVSGNGYFVNTTSGAITVTLPAGSAGSIVALKDYGNTWDTNNVTVTPNGTDKINGTNDSTSLNTESQSVTLIYVDATKGWQDIHDSTSNVTGATFITATGGTIVTCGDYKSHIFTSPGTFTVCSVGNPAGSDSVDYFVVAGGGGGAGNRPTVGPTAGGGGGGAGGFRVSNYYGLPAPTMSPLSNPTNLPVTATGYPVTVGGGGANGVEYPSSPQFGTNGSNSIFSTITSAGGGGGSYDNTPGSGVSGSAGGSGGGPGRDLNAAGGAGNTPPVSPPQGNNGGTGLAGPYGSAGGGGGAGAVGGTGTTSNSSCSEVAGPGGSGSFIANTFVGPTAPSYGTTGPVGSTRYFAGGGGGTTWQNAPGIGTGGTGGGGAGGLSSCGQPAPSRVAVAGTTNTGGGGGGAGTGGAGGSGIVIIRYKYQ